MRRWGNPGLVAMNIKSFKDLEELQRKTMQSLAEGKCGCWRCLKERDEIAMHMVVCQVCGNKRCPKANDHNLACTGSNEPGQPGSAYE